MGHIWVLYGQKSLYGAHVGLEWDKCPDYAHMGPTYTCLLGDFPNPGRTLLSIFPSFRPMDMVGEACLPRNAYYPRMPDYTLCSGVHVCWSEHSDSSFVYGFMFGLRLWFHDHNYFAFWNLAD